MKKECFVLYSSDYDYDELKKEYLEYCEANDLTFSESGLEDYISGQDCQNWNDLESQLDKFDDCVLIGTIARWNGIARIKERFSTVLEALKWITNTDMYFLEVTFNEDHYDVVASHHDGRNTYSIYVLNSKGIAAGEKANLTNKTYYRKIKID